MFLHCSAARDSLVLGEGEVVLEVAALLVDLLLVRAVEGQSDPCIDDGRMLTDLDLGVEELFSQVLELPLLIVGDDRLIIAVKAALRENGTLEERELRDLAHLTIVALLIDHDVVEVIFERMTHNNLVAEDLEKLFIFQLTF